MKLILKILVGIQFFLYAFNIYSQDFLKQYELSLGFSFQKQDRRLFDFPNSDVIIAREQSNNDYQLELSLKKIYLDLNKFSSAFGIGYSMNINKFSRPFNHTYFTGEGTFELRYIENYVIHNLRLYDNLQYKIIGNENNSFSVIIPVGINFALNKHIKGTYGNWKNNKWLVELNNIDAHTGLLYTSKSATLSIAYRILSVQKIDRAIFYFILTHDSTADILNNKYEINNIDNIKVNISYKL